MIRTPAFLIPSMYVCSWFNGRGLMMGRGGQYLSSSTLRCAVRTHTTGRCGSSSDEGLLRVNKDPFGVPCRN